MWVRRWVWWLSFVVVSGCAEDGPSTASHARLLSDGGAPDGTARKADAAGGDGGARRIDSGSMAARTDGGAPGPRDASRPPPGDSRAASADAARPTGGSHRDRDAAAGDVDGGEPSRGDSAASATDARHQPVPEAGAACVGCQCRFPALGIDALNAATSPYVGSRVWGIERALVDLANDASRLMIGAVEGTGGPSCGGSSYDGTPGSYESGRVTHASVGDCDGGSALETYQMTVLNGVLVIPGFGGTLQRSFQATLDYDGTRALVTGGTVHLSGSALLSYSETTMNLGHASLQTTTDVWELAALGSSSSLGVSDEAGRFASVALGRLRRTLNRTFRSVPTTSEELDYSVVDAQTSATLAVKSTPNLLYYASDVTYAVPTGSLTVTDAEHAAETLTFSSSAASVSVVGVVGADGGGFSTAVPYVDLTSGVPWPARAAGSCASRPRWP